MPSKICQTLQIKIQESKGCLKMRKICRKSKNIHLQVDHLPKVKLNENNYRETLNFKMKKAYYSKIGEFFTAK